MVGHGVGHSGNGIMPTNSAKRINSGPGQFETTDDVRTEVARYPCPSPMVVEPIRTNKNRDIGPFLGTGPVILDNKYA